MPLCPRPFAAEPASLPHHALDCILATQIVIDGKRTIWAQQQDALTLAPISARNYEPAALATGESADLLLYLMELPHPSPAVVASVHAGIAWLSLPHITTRPGSAAAELPVAAIWSRRPGAPLLWARYYSIATQKPIFGDRDKTLHDTVSDLSLERRNGYAWYSSGPQQALDAYTAWSRQHPSSAAR